jgi:hypothetical protein
LTVSPKLVVVHSPARQTVTAMVAVPVWLVAGVRVMVQLVPLLLSTILVLGTRVGLDELAVTVRPVPVVPAWPTVNAKGPQLVLTLIVWLAIDEMVGGTAGALTVNPKLVELQSEPAHTVRVMVAVPLWLAAGFTITVQFVPVPLSTMLPLGTKVVFEEAPVTVKVPVEVPLWPTVKGNGPQLVLALIV